MPYRPTTPEELESTRRLGMPAGAIKIRPKVGDVTIYLYTDSHGRPCLRTFYGRAWKPADRYHFPTLARRDAYVARILSTAAAHAERKAERTAKRKAEGRGLVVGDVLRTCWGYEQTNIEWFEVTGLIGSTMVEVRELAAGVEETRWQQGKTVPLPGQYKGEPLRRRASAGAVKIDDVRTAWRQEPITTIGGKGFYEAAHFTAYH